MTTEKVERRLAAILSADVVGYSRLMGADEEGTLARLQALRREFIDPKIAEHSGRTVKLMGDGALVEFGSVVDAVRCAVDVQDAVAQNSVGEPKDRRIEFRVGINLGDVIVEGDDIHGDGVNIAARIEGLSEPGGVCISGIVFDSVKDKLDFGFEDLGPQTLKNIAEPVRVYAVHARSEAPDGPTRPHDALALPSKPSIAVLPFTNMSGDPEQEYFSDGIAEDIITALTLWRSFPVVSGNSTFVYKGKGIRVQRIAEELGAYYVLEGSVRKAGTKVRITTQLSDARTGHHVWAQKFDRDLEDIFAVQDEITQNVAATLVPELERVETKRSAAKQPQNLDAWDCYLRGLSYLYESTAEGNARAREMFKRALELDPNYGPAFTGIGYVLSRDLILSYAVSFDDTAARCLEAAERAVALDVSDSFARTVLVRALLWSGQHDVAIVQANRALELNPYNPQAHIWLGSAFVFAGNHEQGIPHLEKGLELAPRDPRNSFFATEVALAYLTIGQAERALQWARAAAQRRSDFIESHLALASILAHLGDKSEARAVLDLVGIADRRSVERRTYWRFHKHPTTKELVLEGLCKAGLPE